MGLFTKETIKVSCRNGNAAVDGTQQHSPGGCTVDVPRRTVVGRGHIAMPCDTLSPAHHFEHNWRGASRGSSANAIILRASQQRELYGGTCRRSTTSRRRRSDRPRNERLARHPISDTTGIRDTAGVQLPQQLLPYRRKKSRISWPLARRRRR